MTLMVYSLLWVMQDFDHQPYFLRTKQGAPLKFKKARDAAAIDAGGLVLEVGHLIGFAEYVGHEVLGLKHLLFPSLARGSRLQRIESLVLLYLAMTRTWIKLWALSLLHCARSQTECMGECDAQGMVQLKLEPASRNATTAAATGLPLRIPFSYRNGEI